MTEKMLKGYKIGDCAEILHTITEDDHERFIELSGDTNPLHTDREFAEQTSFKGIIAHGMLYASFISTIIGTHIPGEGALCISHSIEFLLPVRIGDVITIRATVVDIHVSLSLMELQIDMINQYEQLVLRSKSRVKVLTLESPEKEEVTKQKI